MVRTRGKVEASKMKGGLCISWWDQMYMYIYIHIHMYIHVCIHVIGELIHVHVHVGIAVLSGPTMTVFFIHIVQADVLLTKHYHLIYIHTA